MRSTKGLKQMVQHSRKSGTYDQEYLPDDVDEGENPNDISTQSVSQSAKQQSAPIKNIRAT